MTLLQRNVAGEGVLLALFDENLRRKALTKTNPNGSILYVDAERNCFFISIYFAMMYNQYNTLFEEAVLPAEKKRIFDWLHKCLQLCGEQLQR